MHGSFIKYFMGGRDVADYPQCSSLPHTLLVAICFMYVILSLPLPCYYPANGRLNIHCCFYLRVYATLLTPFPAYISFATIRTHISSYIVLYNPSFIHFNLINNKGKEFVSF